MWLISSWLFAFMLFNFQGPVLYSLWWISHRSELVYYITLFSACQALFSKFFNFFSKPKFQSKSLVFGLLMSFLSSRASLSRWQLIYNIMPKLFCQHLFLSFLKNFLAVFQTFAVHFCSSLSRCDLHILPPFSLFVNRFFGFFYVFYDIDINL